MLKGSDESHGGAGDVGELYNAQTGTDVVVPQPVGILVDGHTYGFAICGSEDMDGPLEISACLPSCATSGFLPSRAICHEGK